MLEFQEYLNKVCDNIERREAQIQFRSELEAQMSALFAHAKKKGMSDKQAKAYVLKRMRPPDALGKVLNDSY